MVFDSPGAKQSETMRAGNATQIRPDGRFDVAMDPVLPVLCAEDDMIIQRRVCVGHAGDDCKTGGFGN